MADKRDTSIICIFDVDGTVTMPRLKITEEMDAFMENLKSKVVVGLVGGSDLSKITEQMGGSADVIKKFDYLFAENGLVAFKNGEQIGQENIQKAIGDETLQKLINFALRYMSDLVLPCKRGTFVEFRSSMINLCPVGRSCSQAERQQFAEFDKQNNVRQKFVDALREEFKDAGLVFAIGGQISIDVFPQGWDKRFCLQFLEKDNFKEIHFFGDKTMKGGNDHEIFADSRTIGHTVTSPEDTRKQVTELIFK
ncbi:phosphomannomutase 2-like [Haliotis rufescens]|uniref:phosphomannomutase 2-like n=1 Tax=Haliotis rufescens TaxID=6454 RepID=UPI001EAFE775|nr:phosphomannomutase 2-like [Haliotis rufescens]